MGPQDEARLQEWLPASSRAPGVARRAIDRALSDLPPALLDRVRLLVSELVTNAVVHGPRTEDSAVQLTVHTSPKSLTVEVRDTGSGFQRRLLAPSVRGSGWGLFLVEKMSDRWGVNGNDQTRVWFQIDRRAPSVA